MDIIVKNIEDSPFSHKEVVSLLHSSFKERLEQGLHFTISSMDVKAFIAKTKGSHILVAYNSENKELLGTTTVTLKKDRFEHLYIYMEYVAISPVAKRLGIATKILKEITNIYVDVEYIISDTSVSADSSVKWHLKNDFRIIGLESYPSTNYYSYIFRKELKTPSIWESALFCKFLFSLSMLKCKLIKNANGHYTCFGRILKRIYKVI